MASSLLGHASNHNARFVVHCMQPFTVRLSWAFCYNDNARHDKPVNDWSGFV